MLCIFAIAGTAIANDEQNRLEEINREQENVIKLTSSSLPYYQENCHKHIAFLQKMAEKDEAMAQHLLSGCYDVGNGVTKDSIKSLELVRKAAKQGYAPAQSELGLLYYLGSEHITKDTTQGIMYLHAAALQGYAPAQFSLGRAYESGDGVLQDDVQAATWLRKAAEQGYLSGQIVLAKYYESGLGVKKDKAEVEKWYSRATEQEKNLLKQVKTYYSDKPINSYSNNDTKIPLEPIEYTKREREDISNRYNKEVHGKNGYCLIKFIKNYQDKIFQRCIKLGHGDGIAGGCYHITNNTLHDAVFAEALDKCDTSNP